MKKIILTIMLTCWGFLLFAQIKAEEAKEIQREKLNEIKALFFYN